jgi:cytochrome b
MTAQSIRPATLRVWDVPIRLFHWLLVATILVAFLSAFESSPLAPWHQAAGWVAAVLVVFRLVWGITGGELARFAGFLRLRDLGPHLGELLRGQAKPILGHNPLGGLAIIGLLSLVAATVATGALVSRGGEDEVHEAIAYGLLALIVVHVAAVVIMSLATRENLIRAMVTGRKPGNLHLGATDAKPAPAIAYVLAGVVLAASVYGITRFDPAAFQPHAVTDSEGASGPNADAGEVGKPD